MKRRVTLLKGVFLTGILILAGCTSTREIPRPILEGRWEYTMRNPVQGTLSGLMTLVQGEDETWEGHIIVREIGVDEAMTIRSVELDGTAFTLTGAAAESSFTMTGIVEGATMTGENDVVGVGIFSMEATRHIE